MRKTCLILLLVLFLFLLAFTLSCTPKLMGGPSSNVSVTASGSTSSPVLGVSPLSQNFNSININSSSYSQTFTFNNTGTSNATGCSASSLSGTNAAEFSILFDGCSTNDLAVSGTCNVTVVATPASSGAKTATLSRACTTGGTASTTANAIQATAAEGLVKPMIAVGFYYVCALLANGSVKCWGGNSAGQLGQNSTTNVGDGSGPAVAAISSVNLGVNKTVVQILAGGDYSCALLNDGTLKCWGNNSEGGLGQNNTTNVEDSVAHTMANLNPIAALGTNNTPIQLVAGQNHNCALMTDGATKCWGLNSSGQLGQDNTTNVGDGVGPAVTALSSVNLGTNKTALQLAVGASHTCGLINDHSVKCWGLNASGQLGQDNTTTVGASGGSMTTLSVINLGANKTALFLTAGSSHTCAVLNDFTTKCWGLNSSGQLGQDNTTNAGNGAGTAMAALSAINVGVNNTALSITAGSSHTCAVLNDRTSKCWGLNTSGQLGQDSTASIGTTSGSMAALSAINLGTNKTAVQVVAGGSHTCVSLNDGSVKCWGLNTSGQLGQNSTTTWGTGATSATMMSVLAPIQVP